MFKKPIYLSIIPTFRCNKNCPFCLFGQFKFNENTLSLSSLEDLLQLISKKFEIKELRISGGEISILGDFYIELLLKLCKLYTNKIQIFTNLKKINKTLLNNTEVLNVSLNFNNYDSELEQSIENLKSISANKVINIKTLDRSCKDNPLEIINTLNKLRIKSWEIIPYHHTEYLPFKVNDYSFYEEVIKQYMILQKQMMFAFQNSLQLQNIYKRDNYNTQTVYITPNNKIAVQLFDNTNNFSLKELDDPESIAENYIKNEKSRDNFCCNCTSKLKCQANYFFNYNHKGNSCSGAKNLISYYNK